MLFNFVLKLWHTRRNAECVRAERQYLELVSQPKRHFNFLRVMLAVFPFDVTIKADLLIRILFEAKTIIAACPLQFILKLNRIGIQVLLACKLLFDSALYKELTLGVAFGILEVFAFDPVVRQLGLRFDEEIFRQSELFADFCG